MRAHLEAVEQLVLRVLPLLVLGAGRARHVLQRRRIVPRAKCSRHQRERRISVHEEASGFRLAPRAQDITEWHRGLSESLVPPDTRGETYLSHTEWCSSQ